MGKDNGERLDETSGPAGLANDEDDVLDRLAGLKSTGAKPVGGGTGGGVGFRPEKRRRENGDGAGSSGSDDDEADFVKGLIARATKPLSSSTSPTTESQPHVVAGATAATGVSEGPRRIKLKLGAAGAAAAKPVTPGTRSSPGLKDGDTG